MSSAGLRQGSGPACVAVVGHGASLEGAGLGAAIDGCDLVVRFHDTAWQTPADYGARFDLGVLPGPWLYRAWPAVIRHPRLGWKIYRCDHRLKGDVPPGAEVVDLQDWNQRLDAMARVPGRDVAAMCRGLAATIIAASALRPDQILLFGCDALAGGQSRGVRYPSCHPKHAGGAHDISSKHDMAAESRLLPQVATAYGCAIAAFGVAIGAAA